MDIIQTFYDNLATRYDKLFLDWVEPPVSRQGYWKKYFPISAFTSGTVLFFKLSEAVCYVKDAAVDANGSPIIHELFPKEWETKFGIAEAEHKETDVLKVYEEDGLFEVRLPINEGSLIRMKDIAAVKNMAEGNGVADGKVENRNE